MSHNCQLLETRTETRNRNPNMKSSFRGRMPHFAAIQTARELAEFNKARPNVGSAAPVSRPSAPAGTFRQNDELRAVAIVQPSRASS